LCKELASLGLLPIRQHWASINQYNRARYAQELADHKVRDKRRSRCRCDAYKFPHRPGGGLCRYPEPPAVRWQDAQAAEIAERVAKFRERYGEPNAEQMADLAALTTKPHRPYRKRYAGIVRQICRANGLNPIRDKGLIRDLMPAVLDFARQLKTQKPTARYRNVQITGYANGQLSLSASLPGAYPESGLRDYPPTRRELRAWEKQMETKR
jgi:hypothetical protein